MAALNAGLLSREGYHQTHETYLGKSCTKLTAVSFENIMLPDLKVSSNSFIYKCVCDAHGWSLPIDSSMILAVRSLFRNDWPVDAQGKVRWATLAIKAVWAPVRP